MSPVIVEGKLIPPDKDGNLKVKEGESLFMINGVPHRLELNTYTHVESKETEG